MKKTCYLTVLLGVSLSFILTAASMAQNPVAQWNFNSIQAGSTIEQISGRADTVEGYYESAPGVWGDGLRLDGFTVRVLTEEPNRVIRGNAITIEAWIALGNYPWNWCPVLSTQSLENKGYRLLVGPQGQASLEVAINEQWVTCSSESLALPLRSWMHLTGVYEAHSGLRLFINGQLVNQTNIADRANIPANGYVMGMVDHPQKPSDIHRIWGTLPQFFGLDGILDEVKVYDKALTTEQVKQLYLSCSPGEPAIKPRRMPEVKSHSNRFAAYYTQLAYYPGWDQVWPVDQDPDIVVTFKDSPVKFVFWRGTRYGPSWISENGNWMTDQSVEAWGTGNQDTEGCFEHMQDRHCRYSHVRIIENNDARIVVHWRYAPTSAYLSTWRVDPKTGWECWVDEYYFIYPDATAIRKVSWKTGTLGYPRQFQETLALLHPGQTNADLLEKDFAWVGDYEGNSSKQSFLEDPSKAPGGPFSWDHPKDFTIQQYQYKSQNKPFICFEPGNKMHLRHASLSGYEKAGGCNHFPVGQARCDGRTTRTDDRPSHTMGFPISDPVVHTEGDRTWWNGLYGMKDLPPDELINLGRAWAYAPELNAPDGFEVEGFDCSERIFQLKDLRKKEQKSELAFTFYADTDHPLYHPAIYIKNWKGEQPEVLTNGTPLTGTRVSLKYELEGNDLIVYIPIITTNKTRITLKK